MRTVAALFLAPLLYLTPEVPVPTPHVGRSDRAGVASGGNVVASNGSIALAVWSETRATSESDLFAARLDTAGNLIDKVAFPVTATPEAETNGRVAWNGTNFVVVWNRVLPTSAFGTYEAWTAEIDTAGAIVRTPVRLGEGVVDAVAANGSNVVVIVQQFDALRQPVTISAWSVENGAVAAQTTLTTAGRDAHIVSTASGFAAIWTGASDVTFARLSTTGQADGTSLPLALPEIGASNSTAALTAIGEDAIVAASTTQGIRLLRIRTSGSPQLIGTYQTNASDWVNGVAATTSEFFIASEQVTSSTWSVLRINSSGAVESTIPFGSAYLGSIGDITLLGGRPFEIGSSSTATSVRDRPGLGTNVTGRFIDVDEPLRVLSEAPQSQESPVIASDGEKLLIAWSVPHGASSYSVEGVLATPAGEPLGEPFEILPDAYLATSLAVVFDGTNYLVVRQAWSYPNDFDYQDVVATHVSRDGVPLSDTFKISSTAAVNARPSLASDGTNVLIAWEDGYFANPHAVYALLTAAGLTNRTDLGPAQSIAVAFNGAKYAAIVNGNEVLRISRDAAVETREMIGSPLVGSQPVGVIASNGDGFLAITQPSSNSNFVAVPLDRDAHRSGDNIIVPNAADSEPFLSDPHLAWNGGAYVMTWSEAQAYFAAFHDVYAARLAADGQVVTPRFSISVTPLDDSHVVPFTIAGHTVLAYRRMAPEAGNASRVVTRMLLPPRVRAVRH